MEPLRVSTLRASIRAKGMAQRIFSPAEAARAVKALQKAGVSVARVKFTADGFEIVAGQPEEQNTSDWFAGSPLYRDVA